MRIICLVNMISTSGILTQELDPELTSKLPPHQNYTAYLGTVKLSIYNIYIYHIIFNAWLKICIFVSSQQLCGLGDVWRCQGGSHHHWSGSGSLQEGTLWVLARVGPN